MDFENTTNHRSTVNFGQDSEGLRTLHVLTFGSWILSKVWSLVAVSRLFAFCWVFHFFIFYFYLRSELHCRVLYCNFLWCNGWFRPFSLLMCWSTGTSLSLCSYYKYVELISMSLNYNTICCFNSCFQTPQLFWVNSVESLLQFQLYLPPITCALHFIVMTRRKEKVFFSSTVLFHQKSLNHHPLEIFPVSNVSFAKTTQSKILQLSSLAYHPTVAKKGLLTSNTYRKVFLLWKW